MHIELKKWLTNPWLAKGLCCFFALLIFLQLYHGISQFKTDIPANSSAAKKQPLGKALNIQSLLRSNFFGEYLPDNLDGAGIKRSRLNLELIGVIYAPMEENSQVIIRSAEGDEKVYLLGDELPGGAIIKRITDGAVIIEDNGSLESLSLPKNALIFEPAPKPLVGE